MNPITSDTAQLESWQAKELEHYLRENQFEPRTVPYARFAGAKRDVNVVFYESGKLVVQGKGTHEFVWDASGVASGVYFCRILASGSHAVVKIVALH